jgi:hypothetical protein
MTPEALQSLSTLWDARSLAWQQKYGERSSCFGAYTAKLSFEGRELTVRLNRVFTWAQSIAKQFKGADVEVEFVERALRLSYGGVSTITLAHQSFGALPLEPIELTARDGRMLIPALPDKREYVKLKAVTAINRKLEKAAGLRRRRRDGLRNAELALSGGERDYALAVEQMQEIGIEGAHWRARQVGFVRRLLLHVEGMMEEPTDALIGAEWLSEEQRALYRTRLDEFEKLKKKFQSYRPESPHSQHAREESSRRYDKYRRAKHALSSMVNNWYAAHLAEEHGEELVGWARWPDTYRRNSYRHYRRLANTWPARRVELEAAVAEARRVLDETNAHILTLLEQRRAAENPPEAKAAASRTREQVEAPPRERMIWEAA